MADINHSRIPNLSVDSLDGSSGVSTPGFQTGPTSVNTFGGTNKFGTSGVAFAQIRKSTVSVAIGGTAADSVTTSVTIPNIAEGDPIIAIVPSSIWSGAYNDLDLKARASASSTVILAATNSTTTAVNTDAMNFDFYWIDLA
jgi:hypothetical protein